MLYELRQYWAQPGCRDELVELMTTRILPYQIEAGVDVVATFVAADDPDAYVWIRRWSSEADFERVTAAVYGGDEWLNDLQPAVRRLMARERTTVTMLTPTLGSPLP